MRIRVSYFRIICAGKKQNPHERGAMTFFCVVLSCLMAPCSCVPEQYPVGLVCNACVLRECFAGRFYSAEYGLFRERRQRVTPQRSSRDESSRLVPLAIPTRHGEREREMERQR